MIDNRTMKEIFFSVIKTSGHIDPVGYLTRAYYLSGGDENYNKDGKIGFYPVEPDVAFDMVGSKDVFSLEGNIQTTLLMEMLLIKNVGYEAMVGMMTGKESLPEFEKLQKHIVSILYPRKATVKDVIKLLKPVLSDKQDISKQEREFYKLLMDYNG